jgi:hypothetical protein
MSDVKPTTPSEISAEHRSALSALAISAELRQVLASPAFCNSKRSKEFLSFVVAKTLAGQSSELKERTIGIEVFGKNVDYDVNEEPVVRVRAGDIRKRLGMYYSEQGNRGGLVIELPAGSYVPRFRDATIEVEANAGEETSAPSEGRVTQLAFVEKSTSSVDLRRKSRIIAGLVALPLLVGLGVGWFFDFGRSSAFDEFWAPVLHSSSPVVIVGAYTPVYLHTDLGQIHPEPFTLVNNGYLGGGDLVAAAQLSGMLGGRHHAFKVRVGNSVTVQDLNAAPSILLGYSIHFWEPVTRDFRYTIRQENGMVLDNGKPTGWIPHNLRADLHVDDDYAIVVRTFDPQTHEIMILVYGAEQYGTQAAAALITDPELLGEALRDAPRDWQKHNLQLVLHTRIVGDYPSVPQVVGSYYW